MVAFTFRMPAGIPGAVSRIESANITPEVLSASAPFSAYGMFGKFTAGAFVPLESGDAASVITGLLVRPYPTNSGQDGLGTSTPPQTAVVGNRLVSGFMTVLLQGATAAVKGGQVYVRTTVGGSGRAVGAIEAAADGGNCVAVTRCTFVGPADASGNVEIQFNV